jgi:hypothetical protein
MRFASIALYLACAASAGAQAPDALPARLSGQWTAVVPGVRTVVDNLAFTFDESFAPGPVKGRLTFRGASCGAQDEPLTGTWNGSELRVDTKHRPNVNARLVNGQCGAGNVTYILVRKPGTSTFEGDAHLDGGPALIRVTVSP